MFDREGLVLTRCDVCGCRQWCAVNGTAMCALCCPGAVEAAREDAAAARKARERAAAEARQERQAALDAAWMDEHFPPSEDDPVGDPVHFREVAHILWPEWYPRPLAA